MNLEEAISAAHSWIQTDPDPETRAELQTLVEAQDESQLRERMLGTLQFGTAGLRAIVGAGAMRMNRAVIRRTTEGVARYLKKHHSKDKLLVVVGADARLSSEAFLRETVGVLAAHGVEVEYFDRPVSTPVAAYVARKRSATAAIVITASHNPATYNGYKLYGSNAVQIVPPVDSQVAAEIDACPPASEIELIETARDGQSKFARPVSADLVEEYYRDVADLCSGTATERDLGIVYTAMHGVGHEPVSRVMRDAGFTSFSSVAAQQEPDGHFPTAPFPNPEEPGALDLAIELARKQQADIIVANDPDVDRLAAALPDESGQWIPLTGNQIGILLADFVLSSAPPSPQPLVAQSIVSSPMLASLATSYNARFEQTLTGFKWLWTAALDLMADPKLTYVFGYEEALGFCAGHLVRDKDGISAALLLCELAAQEKSNGSNLRARLERLYRCHGLWVSVQKSVTLEGLEGSARIASAMDSISDSPPSELQGQAITKVIDYRSGGENRPRWLHNTSLVELQLGNSGRILVRPSGTEPKLKCYVDLRQELIDTSNVWDVEKRAVVQAQELAAALMLRLGLE